MSENNKDAASNRLFNAFFGKAEPPMPDLPPVTLRLLAQMMKNLLKVTDTDWGRYSFAREPLNGKFNDEDRARLTLGSQECGREYAQKLKTEYGTDRPDELAEKMGLNVEYPDMPKSLLRVLFAEYKPKNNIYLYMDAVHKADGWLHQDDIREVMGDQLDIKNILLGHELFHYVEETHKKEIYTYTEKVELWAPPFLHNRSSIACLGEIAAMEFTKQLNHLPYSPFLMDVYLVYGYSQETSCRIYEEIMEIAGLDPDA